MEKEPTPPSAYIATGLLLAILGAGMAVIGSSGDSEPLLYLGLVISAASSCVLLIGLIGAGVALGARHAAWSSRDATPREP